MTLAHVADTKAYRQHEETEFTINGLKSKSQAWLSSLEFILTTKPAPVINDESEFKENYIRAGKIWGHTEHLYAMAFGKLITIMSPEENHKALTEIVEYNESTLSKQVNQLG